MSDIVTVGVGENFGLPRTIKITKSEAFGPPGIPIGNYSD